MPANQRPADRPNEIIDSTIWPYGRLVVEELKQAHLTPTEPHS